MSDAPGQTRVLRFREFLKLQHLSAHGSEEEKLKLIFSCCDSGGDGRIRREDVARVMTQWSQRDMSHTPILDKFDQFASYSEEQFLSICLQSEMKKFNNNIL